MSKRPSVRQPQSQRASDTEFRVRNLFQRELAPGERVFAQGDPGERFFVIQSGCVEIVREEASGRRVVARLGPGDFFGEQSLLAAGAAHNASATATRPTGLLELDAGMLEAMCVERPEIAIRMIRVLVGRLVESERRLAALGSDDLLRPFVRALVRNAEPHEGRSVRIPLTLRELAEQAGLSLLEAHRALHQLVDRKALDLLDDVLIAPDLDTLSASLDVAG